LWIEVGGPAENLGGDLILLQRHTRMSQRVIGEVTKKPAKRLSFAESVAMSQPFDLVETTVSMVGELERCNRHVTFKSAAFYLSDRKERSNVL